MAKKKILTDGKLAALIVVAILVIDQAIKISFIENNGMAFGMSLGSKLALSLFRIAAIGLLGYYIWLQVRRHARTGYIVLLSMVMAGAAGNLIDCMFYGLVFNASSPYYVSY